MSTRLIGCLLIWTFVLAAPAALADPVIVNPNFGAVLITCGGNYAYQGTGGCGNVAQDFNSAPGFGWTLSTTHDQYWYGPGLTGPNTNFNPPPFDGLPFTQAVFLESGSSVSNPSVSQDISGFSPGSYTLSFYLGSRYSGNGFDGNQTVEALIDGSVIGTWALASFTPFTLESASFTVGGGGDHNFGLHGNQQQRRSHRFPFGDEYCRGGTKPSSLILLGSGSGLAVAAAFRRKLVGR